MNLNRNRILFASVLLIPQFASPRKSLIPTTMKFCYHAGIALAAAASTAHLTMASCDSKSGLVEHGSFKISQSSEIGNGEQCTTVDFANDDSVGFHTHIDLVGTSAQETDTNQYETFDIAEPKIDAKLISDIKTIPATLDHSYNTTGQLVSNVAIGLNVGTLDVSVSDTEIDVWTAVYGDCKPTSTTGKPINAQVLLVDDVEFDLYEGDASDHKVYSFVPKTSIDNFNGDLKLFLDKVLELNVVSSDQYLQKVQCSTQVAVGVSADLTVGTFSVKVQ